MPIHILNCIIIIWNKIVEFTVETLVYDLIRNNLIRNDFIKNNLLKNYFIRNMKYIKLTLILKSMVETSNLNLLSLL